MAQPVNGDYVLGTRWTDGDSKDPWAVGFYAGPVEGAHPRFPRFLVVAADGKPIASCSRIKKITPARGKWLLENSEEIEASGRSVWGWLRKAMQPRGYL